MSTKSGSDTNTAPPMWQVQVVPYKRAPGWEVGPETPSKLCSPSSSPWCGAVSAERKAVFSNWHKGTIWVSSSPLQTLGVSALWPSFQGRSSPSLFQSISICFNKYLTVPTLYQTLGLHWWTDRHASCSHEGYSPVEVIPSFFLHGSRRTFFWGSLSWSQPLFSETWDVGTRLTKTLLGLGNNDHHPQHVHLSPDFQGDGTSEDIDSYYLGSFIYLWLGEEKKWNYDFHWKRVRFILET